MKQKKRRPLPARRDPRQFGLALPGLPGTVTVTSLRLKGDLSYEDWERSCRLVGRVGRGVQWWVADLVMYGEAHFSDKWSQGVEAIGYDPRTLTNIAWVAERIAPGRRRASLSFAHHQQVAGLDDQRKQDAWLDRAERKGWTRAELRAAMKEAGDVKGRGGPEEGTAEGADERWQRIRKALDIVRATRQRLELEQRKHSWDPEAIDDLLNELEAVLYREGEEAQAAGGPKRKLDSQNRNVGK